MPKRPFEMSAAEWYRAYSAASSGGVQGSGSPVPPRRRWPPSFAHAMRCGSMLARASAADWPPQPAGEVKMTTHSGQPAAEHSGAARDPPRCGGHGVEAGSGGAFPRCWPSTPGLELRRYRAAQAYGQ